MYLIYLWEIKKNNVLIVLYNRGVKVNLFELNFPSFHFFFFPQTNKWVFHFSTFPFFQLNTYEKKLNLFYLSTFLFSPHFLSSYFSISSSFFILSLFHSSNRTDFMDLFFEKRFWKQWKHFFLLVETILGKKNLKSLFLKISLKLLQTMLTQSHFVLGL